MKHGLIECHDIYVILLNGEFIEQRFLFEQKFLPPNSANVYCVNKFLTSTNESKMMIRLSTTIMFATESLMHLVYGVNAI